MDRYLFKAKRKNWRGLPKKYWWIQWNIFSGCPEAIEESTICASTGLKDKNGTLIWETDIVRHYFNPRKPKEFDTGTIRWNEKCARYERNSKFDDENYIIREDCEYEVIGNLFDNLGTPEARR